MLAACVGLTFTPFPEALSGARRRTPIWTGVVRLIDAADAALGLHPDPIREFLTWIWRVRAQAADRDLPGHELLRSRGYVRVRSSWTMGRKLAAEEDPGAIPAGVTIRAFETGRDERALHEVHEASFADHWGFRPTPYETFEAKMYEAED
jgi:hypothetical protein